jgi:hypothetical protein
VNDEEKRLRDLGQPVHRFTTRKVVDRCPLCSGYRWGDGTEDHSRLCIEFRALQDRVAGIERKIAKATEPVKPR